MLRLSAILTLIFYLTISYGVHLDIDTCCKSIAGFSFVSDSQTHSTTTNCCPIEKSTCCTSEKENSCEVDCIYLQVLSEEQVIYSSPRIGISEIELFNSETIERAQDDDQAIAEETHINDPPFLPYQENLQLHYKSLVTYG